LDVRDGVLVRGQAGWGEFSPFWDYDDTESAAWLRAAWESAAVGWPAPVRDLVPVNVTVPAVGPERAAAIVAAGGGCRTAKVKVAQKDAASGAVESLDAEVDRVAAVRQALDALHGPGLGKIRVDANGAWTVSQAARHIRAIDVAAGGLEYVEQPCATVEHLADLRRRLLRAGIDVPVAADESIRRASDPLQVKALDAADIAVFKVQPLGGVQACLDLAERIGLPVVVSSAIESSVGLAAGVALAGALPDLPYACGLATSQLLTHDVVAHPLTPVDGMLPVLSADDARLEPSPAALAFAAPSDVMRDAWLTRMARVACVTGLPCP
jgi:O-succinylbenzoate synthase